MISLIIGISLLLKLNETAIETVEEKPKTEIKIERTIENATTTSETPEAYLRSKSIEYGLDPDMVIKIAKCESSLNPNAVSHTNDHGLLQVNFAAHNGSMQEMGLNIYSAEDSTEYGLRLMQKEGVRPWKASAHCHGYTS